MAIGLFISAAARTTDRAVTVLPIVLVLLLVLALGAVFPQIGQRPVLNQLGYLGTTQWAFAGMASTVDLNDLQVGDRRPDPRRLRQGRRPGAALPRRPQGRPRGSPVGPRPRRLVTYLRRGASRPALVAALATGFALRRDEAGRRLG